MSSKDKRLAAIVGLVLLVLFSIYVWPTRYRYAESDVGVRQLVRVDRFTGEAEALGMDGWYSLTRRAY